jgi:beta-lactamase regulating signal transducer with metallopeptidase domain
MTRGLSAWDELIKTEADIRKKRQNMIYAQQERRQEIMNIVAIILLLIGLSGIIIGVIYLVMMDRGMV